MIQVLYIFTVVRIFFQIPLGKKNYTQNFSQLYANTSRAYSWLKWPTKNSQILKSYEIGVFEFHNMLCKQSQPSVFVHKRQLVLMQCIKMLFSVSKRHGSRLRFSYYTCINTSLCSLLLNQFCRTSLNLTKSFAALDSWIGMRDYSMNQTWTKNLFWAVQSPEHNKVQPEVLKTFPGTCVPLTKPWKVLKVCICTTSKFSIFNLGILPLV